jgi:hypothetical protein
MPCSAREIWCMQYQNIIHFTYEHKLRWTVSSERENMGNSRNRHVWSWKNQQTFASALKPNMCRADSDRLGDNTWLAYRASFRKYVRASGWYIQTFYTAQHNHAVKENKYVFLYLNFMLQRCRAFHNINHIERFDRGYAREKKKFIQNLGPETDGTTACRKTQKRTGAIFKKLKPG